ncbi:MAG: toxin [Candidatus Omnitrophica bacterium CG12_big_fil_rev_8_21_14_0_65_50_5]|nr:MAG: toxin [Candidatus Omnitrophica bacterium CG12_big_fil_rev_8_21_14_0_65_50_5]
MKFEFDPKKSQSNFEKHGLTFEEAKALWNSKAVVLKARCTDEERFMMMGTIKGKIHSCIFTVRKDAIRLISVRRSHEKEERFYAQKIRND